VEYHASNVLAAHTLVGTDGFDALAAIRAAEIKDVCEFAGTVSAGNTFHCQQDSAEMRKVPYQYKVILTTEYAGFFVGCGSGPAEVDIEVGQGAIAAHQDQVGHVQVRGVQ
jgi:hypothetical protein